MISARIWQHTYSGAECCFAHTHTVWICRMQYTCRNKYENCLYSAVKLPFDVQNKCTKMSFYCFRCEKIFIIENEAISHLKKDHNMLDNVSPIRCVIRNCEKTYNTFRGLRNHLKNINHQSMQVVEEYPGINIDHVAEQFNSVCLVEQNEVICEFLSIWWISLPIQVYDSSVHQSNFSISFRNMMKKSTYRKISFSWIKTSHMQWKKQRIFNSFCQNVPLKLPTWASSKKTQIICLEWCMSVSINTKFWLEYGRMISMISSELLNSHQI